MNISDNIMNPASSPWCRMPYVSPGIRSVAVRTRKGILQGSVQDYGEGSHSGGEEGIDI